MMLDPIREVNAALHECAVRTAALAATPVHLGPIWHDLASGNCRVEAHFFTDQRCYLVLAPKQARGRRRPSAASLLLLQRVLLDGGQKTVAFDFGVTCSTVTMRARHCLEFMGLACSPSKVPLLLVMAAYAARHPTALVRALAGEVVCAGQALRVVSAERPDATLAGLLSAAEYQVTRLVVEGHSYAEIAARRGTSIRTVANQRAMAFQRLGVSGRSELPARE